MKSGLAPGQTAEVEITVTPDMRAQFEGKTVHDLYSTSALVHHMEWAARKTILPFLETKEEGMGTHVEVDHLMMTPVGMKVTIKATVSDIKDNKVDCHIEAFNARGKICKGRVTQAIVAREWLEEKVTAHLKGEHHG